jgi:hypothetical protein
MTEQELLLDCLRRLNASGVAYFLTGSMAAGKATCHPDVRPVWVAIGP